MSVIKIFDIHTTKLLPTACQEQQIPLAAVNDDLMLKIVNGGGVKPVPSIDFPP